MTLAIVVLPKSADAFWPFSTNADAAVNAFIPDSGTPALTAAINSDPNPNKGLGQSIQTSGDKALIAFTGPSGTIADVPSSVASDRISVYVVRKGDTLSDIAKMFDVSVNTIIWANNLKGVGDVHVGDTLIILPVTGLEHTVVKGETLKSLAKKFSADADEIAQYNGLDAEQALSVGSKIIIPGGEISAPPVLPTTVARPTPYAGSSTFIAGYYSNPLPGGIMTQGLHDRYAVDIGSARGTPVRASADGTVIIARVGWDGGYGTYVVITHSNGTQTLYAHLSSMVATAGQSIEAGDVLGYVGMTGRTTGPHLHFEVRGGANPFRSCRVGTVCSPQ